jgi:hypothetical protein
MNQQFRMVKQMIDLQKASSDGMLNSLVMLWEQTGTMIEGATMFPEEGRKALRQWVDINKKACDNLKGVIGSSYSSLEKFFATCGQQD